jgi:hypothetical protein
MEQIRAVMAERLDPAWEMAEKAVESIPHIKMTHYLTRISNITATVMDFLRLHSESSYRIAEERAASIQEMINQNPQIWATDDVDIQQQEVEGISEFVQQQVSAYGNWILSQGLVSFCTFLDGFFEDVVDIRLQQNVALIYDTASAKRVDLRSFVEKELPQIIDEVRKKETRHFSYLPGIKKRIGYLESKLGIPTSSIFDWAIFLDADEFEGWDLDKLDELYDNRHSIVHRDAYPVQSVEDLIKM